MPAHACTMPGSDLSSHMVPTSRFPPSVPDQARRQWQQMPAACTLWLRLMGDTADRTQSESPLSRRCSRQRIEEQQVAAMGGRSGAGGGGGMK